MWIQLAECCTQTEIFGRVSAEFRSSSGRASAGVPYIGQPPVLYFPRLCPTSAGARLELGRCPIKKILVLCLSQMHGTPADTRPCTGRRVFRCGYDGAAMRALGESPVKFSSEVKISPSCNRCGFKQQMPRMSGRCSAEFGENRIAGSSEPHRPGYVTGPNFTGLSPSSLIAAPSFYY